MLAVGTVVATPGARTAVVTRERGRHDEGRSLLLLEDSSHSWKTGTALEFDDSFVAQCVFVSGITAWMCLPDRTEIIPGVNCAPGTGGVQSECTLRGRKKPGAVDIGGCSTIELL